MSTSLDNPALDNPALDNPALDNPALDNRRTLGAPRGLGRGVDLKVSCVLPQLNPHTDLGRSGISAFAARAGVDEETFVKERFGDTPLSPTIAGDAIVSLLTDERWQQRREVLLTGGGLKALPS